jgi:hypothetical protein
MDHKLNTNINHLAFELGGQLIWGRYKGHATFKVSFFILVVYAKVVVEVKL